MVILRGSLVSPAQSIIFGELLRSRSARTIHKPLLSATPTVNADDIGYKAVSLCERSSLRRSWPSFTVGGRKYGSLHFKQESVRLASNIRACFALR